MLRRDLMQIYQVKSSEAIALVWYWQQQQFWI